MPFNLRDIILFFTRDLWLLDHTQYSGWKSQAVLLLRRLYLSTVRFNNASCAVRASSLTTVTLISIVPVLAFGFSLLKAIGGHKEIHEQFIIPSMNHWLGESQAPELREAAEQLLVFVEETDLSSLGLIGFFTVIYAVIRLLGSVEQAFNELWRIRKSRPIYRKLTDYVGVILVVPIFLLTVVSLTTAMQSQYIFEFLMGWMRWAVSVLILPVVWIVFAMMYQIMPNVGVKLRASLSGGVVGGTLWLIVNYAHINLQVGVANYNALYASFSAFPIFIIWVYFSWSAILVGGAFAAGLQTEEAFRRSVIRDALDFHDRERLTLMVSLSLTDAFVNDRGALSLSDLSIQLSHAEASLEVVLADLKEDGLVEKTIDAGYLFSKSPQRISLIDVLHSVKGVEAEHLIKSQKNEYQIFVEDSLNELNNSFSKVAENVPLTDFLQQWKEHQKMEEFLTEEKEKNKQHVETEEGLSSKLPQPTLVEQEDVG